jgi:DNA-binding NarL/FixJ family response regulator
MTRVLIADGHQQFRSALRRILEREPDITVVGEAANTAEAIEQRDQLEPDVVVIDVALPGEGGIQTTMALKRGDQGIGVVLLSVLDEVDSDLAALENTGYVLKGVPADEIVAAIRRHGDVLPAGIKPKTAA